ncbi:hypothetical protein GCM10010411_91370 [Actinomadura fulvescens]|uniref:Uncharacterized protein n=1 Tax=Actinomadura fulvescens TaxID=46160 RepID=A0ABN3QXR1_9ACTN
MNEPNSRRPDLPSMEPVRRGGGARPSRAGLSSEVPRGYADQAEVFLVAVLVRVPPAEGEDASQRTVAADVSA